MIAEQSKYLTREEPVVVDRTLACILGLEEAIVISQLQYWLVRKPHERDGRLWHYNSYPDWLKQFPFFKNTDRIGRIFRSLEDQGVVISTQQYNQSRTDRKKWYAIDHAKLDEVGDRYVTVEAAKAIMKTAGTPHSADLHDDDAELHGGRAKVNDDHAVPHGARAMVQDEAAEMHDVKKEYRRVHTETTNRGLSNRTEDSISQPNQNIPGTNVPAWVISFVDDFAREFRDKAPFKSSVTRLTNLWTQSRLSADSFIELMYEARTQTQKHSASIESRSGDQTSKMAYWFATLENLVATILQKNGE